MTLLNNQSNNGYFTILKAIMYFSTHFENIKIKRNFDENLNLKEISLGCNIFLLRYNNHINNKLTSD